MSNLMIALLTVFAFAAGLGLGLVLVMRQKTPSYEQKLAARQDRGPVNSTVYFGRDDKDDDHPHDIERQGSRFAPRDAEHRYDGMTDGEAPHVPVGARGLDFGSTPR
jgi:hypothetical protein